MAICGSRPKPFLHKDSSEVCIMRWRLAVWSLAAVLLGVVAFASGANGAQLPVDKGKLEAKYNKDYRQIIDDLTKGKTSAKENAEAVDVLAQWHTYRITWPEVQSIPGAISGRTGTLYELDTFLQEAVKNKPATGPFLEMFGAKAAEDLREVFKDDKLIARVNGAIIMEHLANAGIEEIADLAVDAIKDKDQNAAVKFWVVKALGDLFEKASQPNSTIFQSKAGKVREANCIAALGEFINQKIPVSADLPRDEKEGIRVPRREAIRALAFNRKPVLTDDKGAVVDRPGLTLLRVVRGVGLEPEPRLDEQIEAAVGVARLSPKAFEGYQPDYAAYQLGQFVSAFALATNTKSKEARAKEPWKKHAARLMEALDGMKAEAANSKDAKYIAAVHAKCMPVLTEIERNGKAGEDAAALLGEWVTQDQNRPPNGTLYKGDDDSVIKEGEAEAPKKKPADKDKPADKSDKPEKK
jgi:hypothetical protein